MGTFVIRTQLTVDTTDSTAVAATATAVAHVRIIERQTGTLSGTALPRIGTIGPRLIRYAWVAIGAGCIAGVVAVGCAITRFALIVTSTGATGLINAAIVSNDVTSIIG